MGLDETPQLSAEGGKICEQLASDRIPTITSQAIQSFKLSNGNAGKGNLTTVSQGHPY